MTFSVSRSVSDETLNCIIQIESGGNPRSKASTSSALGLGQFLNATWIATVQNHRPDILSSNSLPKLLALRTDPSFSIEMLARFTEDNQKLVGSNCTPGDLYLAHFLGAGTAAAVCRAPPETPVVLVVGEHAVDANKSVMAGKTCAQVRAWSAKRMHESGGHSWVKKFYTGPEPLDLPQTVVHRTKPPKAAPIKQPEPAPEPLPSAPAPLPPSAAPIVAPPPQLPAVVDDGQPSWLKRRWKALTGWLSGGAGVGALGYFTDWHMVAVVIAGGFIITVVFVEWMGPADVRAWIRKQVA
jgi:hypothetical protein